MPVAENIRKIPRKGIAGEIGFAVMVNIIQLANTRPVVNQAMTSPFLDKRLGWYSVIWFISPL
jgi:hypothetical protein